MQQKQKTQKIIKIFELSEDKQVQEIAEKMRECGEYIGVAECQDCGAKHFRGYNRCKQKFCPVCCRVKSMIWVARIMQAVRPEDKNYYMLTLTIRDSENLGDCIKRLEAAWRYFYNSSKWRKKFKERFTGGVRSLEVKKGKNSGLWHPHYHILIETSKEYKKDIDWIKKAWETGTQGEGKSVNIKKISDKNIIKGVVEVIKYITKIGNEISKNDVEELVNALRGKRQINCFGTFRGLAKRVEEDEEKVSSRDISDFVCQVCGSLNGEYILERFNSGQVIYDYVCGEGEKE